MKFDISIGVIVIDSSTGTLKNCFKNNLIGTKIMINIIILVSHGIDN